MTRSTIRVWLATLLLLGWVTAASAQTYPTAVVTISGSQTGTASGTMTIAFNNHSHTVPYGQYSTASSIASAFAAAFSSYPASAWPRLCTIGVCAKANGSIITFQLKTATSYGSFTISCTGPCPFQAAVTSTQARPVIVWPTPAPISPGTALSSVQLNATTNIPGSFAYTPSVGFVPNPGTQTLSVVFTPTDTVDYTLGSASTSLIVNTIPLPVITSINPTSAAPGTVVTITGSNLGALPGSITIDGFATQEIYWSSGTIHIVVPLKASAGIISLTTSGGLTTNASFTVINPFQGCPI